MEESYFKDVQKLIDEHKAIQNKNLKLADTVNKKVFEIKALRESELKLQSQIQETLLHTVNVENISGQYTELKEKYKKVIDEKRVAEETFKIKYDELEEQHQKQIQFYEGILVKEKDKFKLKETDYFNELKKTSAALSEQVQQVELKWKMLLEDANRKLKESNLSCSTLRSQLVQASQRHSNVEFLEKKIRELEHKLEATESDLHVAKQALYLKENYKSPNSPVRDLYRANNRKGPFKISKKTAKPNLSGDAPQSPGSENCCKYSLCSLSSINKQNSAPETSFKSTVSKLSMNRMKHTLPSSCESTPVQDMSHKPKKRRLYDPSALNLDSMMWCDRPNQ